MRRFCVKGRVCEGHLSNLRSRVDLGLGCQPAARETLTTSFRVQTMPSQHRLGLQEVIQHEWQVKPQTGTRHLLCAVHPMTPRVQVRQWTWGSCRCHWRRTAVCQVPGIPARQCAHFLNILHYSGPAWSALNMLASLVSKTGLWSQNCHYPTLQIELASERLRGC